jgi:amidase
VAHAGDDRLPFLDVPPDHWAAREIWDCADADLVAGYPDGYYRPDLVVTRDQMAAFIARAFRASSDEPEEPTFPDVPPDHWAYGSIEGVVADNIVEGYPDGNYHPEWDVTRGQMAVFIARASAAPPGEEGLADYEPPLVPAFDDVPSDYWCYRHVEYLASLAVVDGYPDGLYRPGRPVTRDQMAVYLARALLYWRA